MTALGWILASGVSMCALALVVGVTLMLRPERLQRILLPLVAFGVLVHGGWRPLSALLYNVLSASTFLVGGLVAYAMSARLDITLLLPFAAGNFLYIAASDLVPEVKHDHGLRANAIHLVSLLSGIVLLYIARVALEG